MAYQVIPRTLTFVFWQDSVLLLKGALSKKNFPGLLNGLGGHVERGESIVDSARREVFEESGLSLPWLDLCGLMTVDTGESPGIQVFIYKAVLVDAPGPLSPSDEGALDWYPVDKVAELDVVPDVPDYFDLITAWERGCPVFYVMLPPDAKGSTQVQVAPGV